MRRAPALVAWAVACLALALGGVWAGVRLAPAHTAETPLGDVRLRATTSWQGGVDAYVPLADWGARAAAFRAPVTLRLEPRTLRRDRLLAAAGGETRLLEATRDTIETSARTTFRRAALHGMGGALAGAVVVALLAAALRRRARTCALLAAGVLLAAGAGSAVVLWRVQTTFDVRAVERPTFYGRGEEVVQLLQAAERAREAGNAYSTRVERAVRAFATLLSRPAGELPRDGSRLLVGSDLHNNGLVFDALERFAEDATTFYVGDFGIDGSPGERALVRRAARLGRRVVAVSGNHDSGGTMRTLAEAGALVLRRDGVLGADGRVSGPPVVEVDGLRVAGFDDPLEDRTGRPGRPERIFSFPERRDGKAELAAAKDELVRWFDGLPAAPDLVLVHQNALAQHLARVVGARPGAQRMVVLTGHDHRQHIDLAGPVAVVDAGTLGAGGIVGAGVERVGLAELVRVGREVWAVDLVRTDPFTGATQGERVLLDACPDGAPACRLADPDADLPPAENLSPRG